MIEKKAHPQEILHRIINTTRCTASGHLCHNTAEKLQFAKHETKQHKDMIELLSIIKIMIF